jgi:hypothetical protein
METKTIETLAEFTMLIEETCVDQSDILFRGVSGDFPLLPSIARERLTDDLLAVERSMLEEFQRHSLPHLGVAPETLWEWAALAAHHGLPTRLLDWSLNPLTSLWFVVRKPATQGRGTFWILRPEDRDFATETEKNLLECRRHMVFAPRHVTERITAQGAWFTVHKAWAGDLSLEPLESSAALGPKLTKVTIPADRFAHFRFHLDRYGVNSASVFPGLDGLCAHIRWKRCYMEDEGETRTGK